MESPKTLDAYSRYSLSLGGKRGPICDPKLSPLTAPQCRGISYPRKGPIAKLGRSGLQIGGFSSSCKSVKSVSFCRTCPGMPDQPRLA